MKSEIEEVYVVTQKGTLKQTGVHGVMNPMVFKTFEDIVLYIKNTYVGKDLGWELEHTRNPKWHGIGLVSIVIKNGDRITDRVIFKTFISRLVSYDH